MISTCVLSVRKVGTAHADANEDCCCWWVTPRSPSFRIRQTTLSDSLVNALLSASGRVVKESSCRSPQVGQKRFRLACASLLLGSGVPEVLRGADCQHRTQHHNECVHQSSPRRKRSKQAPLATKRSLRHGVALWLICTTKPIEGIRRTAQADNAFVDTLVKSEHSCGNTNVREILSWKWFRERWAARP